MEKSRRKRIRQMLEMQVIREAQLIQGMAEMLAVRQTREILEHQASQAVMRGHLVNQAVHGSGRPVSQAVMREHRQSAKR